MNLDPELLQIVVCPACRGSLDPRPESATLRCTQCGLGYPVVDDIPVLLVDEATRDEAGSDG